MYKKIFGFFSSFLDSETNIVFAVIIAALVGIAVIKHKDVVRYEAKLDNMNKKVSDLESDILLKDLQILDLKSSVEKQNTSITNYENENEKLKKSIVEAGRQNAEKDVKLNEYLKQLGETQPVPEQCEAQISWLLDNAKRLRQAGDL